MQLISKDDALKMIREWFEIIDLNPDILVDSINSLPTIEERKEGKWEQISVFNIDEATTIDQLQSTYCPNCHRYHTTPYVYSYYHYDYCPNCGSRMKGEK